MDEFTFKDGDASARGTPIELGSRPRFKVLKGSTARKSATRNQKRYHEERQRLVVAGVLSDLPSVSDLLIFTRDYEANSASMAAGVICGGGNFSGPEKWFETTSGEAFNDWLKKRL